MKKMIYLAAILLMVVPLKSMAFQVSCYPYPSIPDMDYELLTLPGYSVGQDRLQLQFFEHGASPYQYYDVTVHKEQHGCVPKKGGGKECSDNVLVYKGFKIEFVLYVNRAAGEGKYFGQLSFFRNGLPEKDNLVCTVTSENQTTLN